MRPVPTDSRVRRSLARRRAGGSLLGSLLPGLVSLAAIFAAVPIAMADDAAEVPASRGNSEAASSMQAALDRQLEAMPAGEEGVATIMAELTRRLQLSQEQQGVIRPIVGDAVASMEKIRDRYRAGEISAMALGMQLQMAGQRAATRVEPHLDADQITEYSVMRQEQRREMMKAIQQAGIRASAPAGAQ